MARFFVLAALLSPLLVRPAHAAAPYAEDAAAVAAFFASSVALTGKTVAVHEVEGPAPAGALAHPLRAELFRLGAAVSRPESSPEFDLRGSVLLGPERPIWQSSLWQRADGKMVAVYDKVLGAAAPPATPAPPSSAQAQRPRRWGVAAGALIREGTKGWIAEARCTDAEGRWEAALDAANIKASSSFNISVGPSTFRYEDIFDFYQFRLKASRLFPLGGHPRLEGWAPRRSTLRVGVGLAALHLKQTTKTTVAAVAPSTTYTPNDRTLVLPAADVGLRVRLSSKLGVDLGLEWLPRVESHRLHFGGFGAALKVFL